MNTLGKRLKECRKSKNATQAQVAKKVGMSQTNLSELENDLYPTSSFIPSLADHYGVSALWLATGKGSREQSNVAPAPDLRGYVPLISWVRAGDFAEAIDDCNNNECELVPITVSKGEHTFALSVVGDSMSPDFPEGMRLVIEPNMEAQHGDYIIAKNGGEATFKQLVRDGGEWYLKPINKQYPTKLLGESRIIGVVREAVRKFR